MSYNFIGSGDYDQNNDLSVGDAASIARAVVGLSGYQVNKFCFVNNPSDFGVADPSIGDAATVARVVVGLAGYNIDPLVFAIEESSLVFNKARLLKSLIANGWETTIGAIEIEFADASNVNVTVPDSLKGDGVYNMSGPNRFAYVNTNGLQLSGDVIENKVLMPITYSGDSIRIAATLTRVWNSQSNEPNKFTYHPPRYFE